MFEHRDDLWLIVDDTTAVNITGRGDVFNFVCDPVEPGLIYYSVLDGKLDMDVFALSLPDTARNGIIGSIQNETGDISYFVTETYGERAGMEVQGGDLLVECEFSWDRYYFADNAVMDLSSIRGDMPEREAQDSSEAEHPDIVISDGSVNGIRELFCTRSDGRTYQLTSTEGIHRYDEWFLEDPPSYSVSPSGNKVIFSVVTDFGDLAHGPLLIVDIDGTNQTTLLPDMMLFNLHYEWMGDVLFYTGYSPEDLTENLYMIDDSLNTPRPVAKGVRNFGVIRF
ncbi:MAG: hypothetical protein JXA64_09685 [Candidatus Fermentibacteraceae bacterium]|nr:hypothetical protein [Candidatus Fermentibacteraceae bacterium]MBN2609369.1 hypothetical protein [Candidatus Fermentibacteraceae bacterium]